MPVCRAVADTGPPLVCHAGAGGRISPRSRLPQPLLGTSKARADWYLAVPSFLGAGRAAGETPGE